LRGRDWLDALGLLANSEYPARDQASFVLAQLAIEKAKLAMSLRGRGAHYRLNEITARHWQELAGRTTVPHLWNRMQSLVESAPAALERVKERLPRAFPERVYTTIRDGVRAQVERFTKTIGG